MSTQTASLQRLAQNVYLNQLVQLREQVDLASRASETDWASMLQSVKGLLCLGIIPTDGSTPEDDELDHLVVIAGVYSMVQDLGKASAGPEDMQHTAKTVIAILVDYLRAWFYFQGTKSWDREKCIHYRATIKAALHDFTIKWTGTISALNQLQKQKVTNTPIGSGGQAATKLLKVPEDSRSSNPARWHPGEETGESYKGAGEMETEAEAKSLVEDGQDKQDSSENIGAL